jgi:predicted nucleic acid-binding protein
VNLYAESSAVLAWLLGEPGSDPVREQLAGADMVLSSDLTLVECERVLIRAHTGGRISEAEAADRHGRLVQAAEHWAILALGEEIVRRARRPFPVEPIRTLDALHLAAALQARALVPETRLLSLDERVRNCGKELGFELLPAAAMA